jgi:hypothetical protein
MPAEQSLYKKIVTHTKIFLNVKNLVPGSYQAHLKVFQVELINKTLSGTIENNFKNKNSEIFLKMCLIAPVLR